jgi:Ser/Thr protein kinase RdoA (MazF antagonist)
MREGVVNQSWLVEAGKDKYVLRRAADFRSVEEIRFEQRYLDHLKARGFPYEVPHPIATKRGTTLLNLCRDRLWLYKYIEGKTLKQLRRTDVVQVANMMAELHDLIVSSALDSGRGATEPFNRGPVLSEIRRFRSDLLGSGRLLREDRTFLSESQLLIPILEALKSSEYSTLEAYHLHRDITPENLIWDGTKLVGLIDFDNVGSYREPLVKDLAVFLQHSCRAAERDAIDLPLAGALLRAYEKRRPLSGAEVAVLPDLMASGFIEDFAYAYWMLKNDRARAKGYRLGLYAKLARWCRDNRERVARLV